MTVENRKVIDVVGRSKADGHVILTISDHLSFDDDGSRLLTLQEKINDYLACLESGEIYEIYPSAIGRQFEISIAFLYPPDPQGLAFLKAASEIVHKAGFSLTYSVSEENREA